MVIYSPEFLKCRTSPLHYNVLVCKHDQPHETSAVLLFNQQLTE